MRVDEVYSSNKLSGIDPFPTQRLFKHYNAGNTSRDISSVIPIFSFVLGGRLTKYDRGQLTSAKSEARLDSNANGARMLLHRELRGAS